MSAGSDDTPRLREALESRRLQLPGVPGWKQLADAAGISTAVLSKLRRGEPVRSATKAKIEYALGWQSGSIDEILAGGEPKLLPADPGGKWPNTTEIDVPEADASVVIAHWGELSPAMQRIYKRVVAEARVEVEQRLAERRKPDSEAK